MEGANPNSVGEILHDMKEGLFTSVESVLSIVEETLIDVVLSVQEMDAIISDWIVCVLDVAPLNLVLVLVGVLSMVLFVLSWYTERSNETHQKVLTSLESERTIEGELANLNRSKVILQHLIQEIDSFQVNARKQVMKDAMALAMLNDKIEVVDEMLAESIFRPYPHSEQLNFEHSRLGMDETESKDY